MCGSFTKIEKKMQILQRDAEYIEKRVAKLRKIIKNRYKLKKEMKKEFKTLGERMYVGDAEQGIYIYMEDVKEFIKKLKGELGDEKIYYYPSLIHRIIDKLAGKELI